MRTWRGKKRRKMEEKEDERECEGGGKRKARWT